MKRDRLYDNKSFDLLWEDGTYVIVKKDPDVKIIHRTLDEDIKLMQSIETVKTYLPKFNMVYNIFDCPSIDGKLLIYATDGDPHRHCFGKHEMVGRYHDDFIQIAMKEYGMKNCLYGEMRDAHEAGYILMFKKKQLSGFTNDKFCSRLDIDTDNPKVKFHYYRFTREQEPEDDIDMEICEKYGFNRNHMHGIYVANYNVIGDWAFIEMPSWKLIPGSAYSKRY